MRLKFFIKIIPRAKQSFRYTRSGIRYQPQSIVNYEKNVSAQIVYQLPKDFKPFKVAVEILSIHFIFPPLKNFSKKKIEYLKNHYLPKTTKPDLTDNLMKSVVDAMKGIVYYDDSQIWHIQDSKKYYGLEPGIKIEIEGV